MKKAAPNLDPGAVQADVLPFLEELAQILADRVLRRLDGRRREPVAASKDRPGGERDVLGKGPCPKG